MSKPKDKDPLDAIVVTATSMITVRQSIWISEQAAARGISKSRVVRDAITLAMEESEAAA